MVNNNLKQKGEVVTSKDEEILIVCCYCDKCYGEYKNGQKVYFTPRHQTNESSGLVSHGICKNCHSELKTDE